MLKNNQRAFIEFKIKITDYIEMIESGCLNKEQTSTIPNQLQYSLKSCPHFLWIENRVLVEKPIKLIFVYDYLLQKDDT